MKVPFLLSIFLPLAAAWVAPRELVKKAVAFGAAASLVVAPLVSNALSDFNGSYSDPNHPNCLRIVSVDGTKASLKGTDGNPGCPADGSGNSWTLTGKVDGDSIFVDFSPKGGPKDLKGAFDGDGIKWPDGNKWTLKN